MKEKIDLSKIENVRFITYDNPGWGISIFLKYVLSVKRTIVRRNTISDSEFFIQITDGNCLETKGSATKLLEIVMYIFKFFELPLNMIDNETISMILWLQNWYANECDEYWEHLYGINGEMDSDGNVFFSIDLKETLWEDARFQKTAYCEKVDGKFVIKCHFNEFFDNLNVFREWIEGNS